MENVQVVREAMSKPVLMIGPEHTLRQAAQLMAARRIGSAVVHDPDGEGPGIITERDMLYAIGSGCDPDTEPCRDHITWDAIYAHPEWSLEEAAMVMVRGGFRHLVVIEDGDVVGLISVRDLMRAWSLRRVEAAASA
jgi:CBS domain-containing protein